MKRAGDEVVVTKSGKKTYGVDWFFSSLSNRPVKGLAFFALSLVGLSERESFPLRIEQIVNTNSEQVNKTTSTAKTATSKTKKKGKRGRPKGSKNKDKSKYVLSSELFRIKAMLSALLETINGVIPLQYLLLDGKERTSQCRTNGSMFRITFNQQITLRQCFIFSPSRKRSPTQIW